jgi:hypothetical protein
MVAPTQGGTNGQDHQLRVRLRPGDHPEMVGKYKREELLDLVEEA